MWYGITGDRLGDHDLDRVKGHDSLVHISSALYALFSQEIDKLHLVLFLILKENTFLFILDWPRFDKILHIAKKFRRLNCVNSAVVPLDVSALLSSEPVLLKDCVNFLSENCFRVLRDLGLR